MKPNDPLAASLYSGPEIGSFAEAPDVVEETEPEIDFEAIRKQARADFRGIIILGDPSVEPAHDDPDAVVYVINTTPTTILGSGKVFMGADRRERIEHSPFGGRGSVLRAGDGLSVAVETHADGYHLRLEATTRFGEGNATRRYRLVAECTRRQNVIIVLAEE